MLHQEKKYRVDSFTRIEKMLADIGAAKIKAYVTFHYYTEQPGNDVIKLIKYVDRDEVHILKESAGTFALSDKITVKDTEAGLDWLEERGHKVTEPIKMASTTYAYKHGTIGLYLLNDS